MKDKLIFLLIAGSLLGMAVEIRYEHRNVIGSQATGWIPIIYCVVAAVACLAALGVSGKGKYVLATILALGPVVGGLGVYFHYQDSPGYFAALVREGVPGGTQLVKAPTEDEEPIEGDPPLLAPMSIAGLSMVGVILLLVGGSAEGKQKKGK